MSEVTRADLDAWLESIKDFILKPVGNQPDSFLLGVMKEPLKDTLPSLELTEDMILPDDYYPEKR